MDGVKRSSYSIFDNITDIKSESEFKRNKEFLMDFCNSINELHDLSIILKDDDILKVDIFPFLVELGIVESRKDMELLKKYLNKEYSRLSKIISAFILSGLELDDLLKKYMDFYRKNCVDEYLNDNTSPTVVDFFCGAGGMSLGFKQNDFKILLANDIEDVCIKTYSFNHPEIPKEKIVLGDIKEIVKNIESYIKEEVDVIVGGPPCQGFSMANRQRIIDDPRNVLYKYYVEGVKKLKPKFFVMENVKGMLKVAEQVKEDFCGLEDVEYEVSYRILNASNFSVPQNRERLIYIGIRKDISAKINKLSSELFDEILNETSELKKYVLNDAIAGLRELKPLSQKNATEIDTFESGKKIELNMYNANEYVNLLNMNRRVNLVYNHKSRYNNPRDIEIYRRMLPGDKSDSERIQDIMPYKSRSGIFKDKYYKLKPNEICKTITAHMKFDCNMYIHPFQPRGLTPREAARVQSYPDDYFFQGAYTKTYMQIGNSVPPLLSRIIARKIKENLKK